MYTTQNLHGSQQSLLLSIWLENEAFTQPRASKKSAQCSHFICEAVSNTPSLPAFTDSL